MAQKRKYSAEERGAELTDLLDALEKLLERTKVLYEQYFMGIQKMAPSQLHRDVERRIRELTQEQIRNTALRFRLTTLTQKFGSYNTYWKRTMRAIEQGRYVRDFARARRRALRRGEDVPDELVAAMPKRMRDRIRRDREKLAERELRTHDSDEAMIVDSLPTDIDSEGDWDVDAVLDGLEMKDDTSQPVGGVYQLDDSMLDDRVDELFEALTREAEAAVSRPSPSPPPERRPSRPQPPAPRPSPPRPAPPAARQSAPNSSAPAASAPAPPAPSRATRPVPTPARSAPSGQPAVPPPPGMSEADARNLYDEYVKARRLVGAREDGITFERLKHKLNEQAPRIMEQHKARELRYDVVVKNDKVLVKATPKRE
ncbi:MXAN_5187 C-terminal domain-containing protein [Haliangium sp.]|uniref:MXAN_5187 C-terminal domain-containing protein n=1 Tax=Haliangium sp. TaxID=2663208 RepID=UPI003D137D07